MRSNKKWLPLVGGVATLALTLGACSNGGGSSSTPSASGNGGGGGTGICADYDPLAEVSLSIVTFNEFGYEDLLPEYEQLNKNVKIEHRKADTADNARAALNTGLQANAGLADIESIEYDWIVEMSQYEDKFMDLTDPAVEGRWIDWKVAQATTASGKLIGYGTDIGPQGVAYRADLFAKAGLPTDRDEVAKLLEGDWDKYFEVGKQFVDATGIPWVDSAGSLFQGMINQKEYPFEDANNEITFHNDPEVRAMYDAVVKAATEDGLSAGLGQWSEDWFNAFQTDGFATMLAPGWMLGIIEGQAAGVDGWDFADVYPGGGGNWGGSFLTVPTQGKNQCAAKALAEWLTAPEQQIKAFKAKGTFPSQVEAQASDDVKNFEFEFFNNAPGEILVNRAKAVKVVPHRGPNYFPIQSAIQDAITRVDIQKSDTPDESWNKALDALKELGII